MREVFDHPNGWGYQQRTGESTNSTFVEVLPQERMQNERTVDSIANLLTPLLMDGPLERNRNSSSRKRRRRREGFVTTPATSNQRIPNTTTPEREIPSFGEQSPENAPLESFLVGSITPDSLAPDLVSLSPEFELDEDEDEHVQEEPEIMEQRFRSRSRANQKLAAALFSHPQSLRAFCLEAYQAAKERRLNTESIESEAEETEDVLLHNNIGFPEERLSNSVKIPRHIFWQNPLLSITWNALNVVQEITLDVSFATVSVTVMVLDTSVHIVLNIWGGVTRFNPLVFVTRPFNMMGMTTEVVVSGIQSVATNVGSASSHALNRLSNRSPLSTVGSKGNLRQRRSPAKAKKPIIDQKLLKKLNEANSAASVLSYVELGDNDGGLSKHGKNRLQRMMHYDVSLRPFVATIQLQDSFKRDSTIGNDYFFNEDDDENEDDASESSMDGPFMCTPQSFPPTPASRAHVLRRGSRFADDVVFLARDQLRVHDALESSNERTREMAQALTHGKRLAVFDADDACAGGIDLSCGQHVATKVGNLLYCSSRSMVPILRNCFVYFEMTVLGRSGGLIQPSMTTLSFGLSTKEMPLTTLVGAWKGSVGLCTTGQILISGQWCSPGPDPSIGPFGDLATVGCLVCLDDSSAFETWEGDMVTATVIFNINGRIVSPHLPSAPAPGPGEQPPTPTETNFPVGAVPPSSSLPLLVKADEELYPTLTLHSPGTSVMCRFSAGDVTALSRDAIGAPKGVVVHAVDGSIVFNDETI